MTNVAGDIAKLSEGKFETIDLNGTTRVPVDVIKAIATSNAEVPLKQIQLLKKCPYLKTRVFACHKNISPLFLQKIEKKDKIPKTLLTI